MSGWVVTSPRAAVEGMGDLMVSLSNHEVALVLRQAQDEGSPARRPDRRP
jgi:hypothetical protein